MERLSKMYGTVSIWDLGKCPLLGLFRESFIGGSAVQKITVDYHKFKLSAI